NGSLVNDIPGAHVNQVLSNQDWKDHIEPDFYVPANARYTLTIDGTALKAADTETVAIIGPSFDLAVRNIAVHPGDKDTLVAEPDATKLSYSSSRPGAPTLEIGVSDHQADYSFVIGGVSEQPGGTLNLGLPAESGSLALQYVGPGVTSSLNLKMTRETE